MPGFPLPLGAGEFQGATRQEDAEDMYDRLCGDGGLSADPASVFRRTLQIAARGVQSVSLGTDRVLEQFFPETAQPNELLPDWEKYLHVPTDPSRQNEERQAIISGIVADRSPDTRIELGQGAGRGMDTVAMIEKVVGVGNCAYLFNTAAAIAAAGLDPRLIFAVAFIVPPTEIGSVGQLARLRKIIEVHKPVHVGAAISAGGTSGFLYDDAPNSLTDRDVLRV